MKHDLEALAARIRTLTGGEPRSWRRIEHGYTAALRYLVGKVPADFPSLADDAHEFHGWREIGADPAGFLSLGFASAAWLSRALPRLIEAEQAIRLDGDALVHMDIRSDNLCFHGDRTLLVDWNWARRGNPAYDRIGWLHPCTWKAGRRPGVHARGTGDHHGNRRILRGWRVSAAAGPSVRPGDPETAAPAARLGVALGGACA